MDLRVLDPTQKYDFGPQIPRQGFKGIFANQRQEIPHKKLNGILLVLKRLEHKIKQVPKYSH